MLSDYRAFSWPLTTRSRRQMSAFPVWGRRAVVAPSSGLRASKRQVPPCQPVRADLSRQRALRGSFKRRQQSRRVSPPLCARPAWRLAQPTAPSSELTFHRRLIGFASGSKSTSPAVTGPGAQMCGAGGGRPGCGWRVRLPIGMSGGSLRGVRCEAARKPPYALCACNT